MGRVLYMGADERGLTDDMCLLLLGVPLAARLWFYSHLIYFSMFNKASSYHRQLMLEISSTEVVYKSAAVLAVEYSGYFPSND